MNASEIIFVYVSPTVAALVILVNLLEIYFIWRARINTHFNKSLIFVFNLSISDLFVGGTIILVKIFYKLQKSYPNSSGLVQATHFSMFCALRISLFLSVLNLLACAFIRLAAVKKPQFFLQLTRRTVIRTCIGIWVVSTITVTVYYAVIRTTATEYNSLIFPAIIFPASILLIWCYIVIFVTFRNVSNESTIESQVDADSTKKVEQKILKFAGAATIVFLVCWLPISFLMIPYYATSVKDWKHYRTLEYILFNLAFLNSLLNPIIYLILLREKGPLIKGKRDSSFVMTESVANAPVEKTTRVHA